jgi:hypothetical protein
MTQVDVLEYAAHLSHPPTIHVTLKSCRAGILVLQIRAAHVFDEYARDHDAFM